MKQVLFNRMIALLAVILTAIFPIRAQLTDWINLTDQRWISHIALTDDILWISTRGGGIVRYDKTSCTSTIITHLDGLTDNHATGIACRGDQLWIGGRNYGIDLYRDGTFQNFNSTTGHLRFDYYNSDFAVDRHDRLWIAGLLTIYRYDDSGFHPYSLPRWDIRSDGIFQAIAVDPADTVWFGGFCFGKISPDERITVIGNDIQGFINDIAIAPDGTKWIAADGGLYRSDGVSVSSTDVFRTTTALDFDHDGDLWYGDIRGCLVRYMAGNSTAYQVPSGIAGDFVTEVVCDGGTIWVGMRRSGLWSFSDGIFEHIDFGTEPHSIDNANNIVADRDGNAILSTTDGIVRSDTAGTFIHLLDASDSSLVYIDPFDRLWIAPNDSGDIRLICISASDTTRFTAVATPLRRHTINVIHVDPAGRLWIGTPFHGLYMYDGTSWTSYTATDSPLPTDRITDIASYGSALWVSTHFHGLCRIEDGRFTIFDKSTCPIPSDFSRSIVFDDSGNLWCATCDDSRSDELPVDGPEFGHGLTRFNGTTWTNYNSDNSPLCSNTIMDIAVDRYGHLWLATLGPCGLTCFDGHQTWTTFDVRNSGISYNYVRSIAINPVTAIIWLTHLLPFGISAARIDLSALSATPAIAPAPVFSPFVYDLLGRPVPRSSMQPGHIYIDGGKKTVLTR